MSNLDLNILFDAIKLVESKVYRDFSEIENLQNSHATAALFAKKTLDYLNDKFFNFFSKVKENYNIVIKGSKDYNIDKKKSKTIFINPISGIMNFIHAIPYFCTTIYIVESANGKNNVLCGIVNNYATQELFYVEKNKGCFLKGKFNDLRLRVSNRSNLNNSIVSIKYDSNKERFKKVLDKVDLFKINNCTILDITNVSAGKYDAAFIFNKNIFELDLGILFIREAGGNFEYSKDKNDILLSNSLLYTTLKELI